MTERCQNPRSSVFYILISTLVLFGSHDGLVADGSPLIHHPLTSFSPPVKWQFQQIGNDAVPTFNRQKTIESQNTSFQSALDVGKKLDSSRRVIEKEEADSHVLAKLTNNSLDSLLESNIHLNTRRKRHARLVTKKDVNVESIYDDSQVNPSEGLIEDSLILKRNKRGKWSRRDLADKKDGGKAKSSSNEGSRRKNWAKWNRGGNDAEGESGTSSGLSERRKNWAKWDQGRNAAEGESKTSLGPSERRNNWAKWNQGGNDEEKESDTSLGQSERKKDWAKWNRPGSNDGNIGETTLSKRGRKKNWVKWNRAGKKGKNRSNGRKNWAKWNREEENDADIAETSLEQTDRRENWSKWNRDDGDDESNYVEKEGGRKKGWSKWFGGRK